MQGEVARIVGTTSFRHCYLTASTICYYTGSRNPQRTYCSIPAKNVADGASNNSAGVMTVRQIRSQLLKIFGSDEVQTPEILAALRKRAEDTTKQGLIPQKVNHLKTQAIIPLSTDKRLRQKYVSSFNKLRIGRLLEDIDTCAVWTSVQHAKQLIDPVTNRFPLVVVTASADRINLPTVDRSSDRDIRITGQVTWVGKSSAELTLSVEQRSQIEQSSDWVHLIEARLVMVARHASPAPGSSVRFVPLVAESNDAEGQRLLEEAQQRRAKRVSAGARSLLKTVPSVDETSLIHELFLRTIDEHKMTFRQRFKPQNAVWLAETGIKTAILCHPQERNAYNKVFGGFLMRQLLEIAWITARRFSLDLPMLIAIDDLVFQQPVEIGSTLFLSSFVVYRPPNTNRIVVRVNAEVLKLNSGLHQEERLVTNTAYIIYELRPDVKLRDVHPETYADSMMYLDGKRHYELVMESNPAMASPVKHL